MPQADSATLVQCWGDNRPPDLEGHEIARVIAGTPAEHAGLRPGDVVVAMDGTPVFKRGCERWNEEGRNKITLTLLRDGETFDQQLEVVDIVP